MMRKRDNWERWIVLLAGVMGPAAGQVNAQAPEIIEQPADVAICDGDDAIFWVEAVGPNLSYQWRKNGNSISGAVSDTLHIINVLPSHAGTYDVVVSNSYGSATSSAAVLRVDTGPVITQQPRAANVCEGIPVTLSVTATTIVGTLRYQWYKDDVPFGGATGSSLDFPNPTVEDSGEYRVAVSNDCGTLLSAAVLLWVDGGPQIVEQPQGAAVCQGEPYTLSVTLGNLITMQQDVTGSNGSSGTGPRLRGNYYRATKNIRLTRIEQYLTIATPGPLVFYVYEATAESGPYNLVLEDNIASAGPGTGYFGSNPLNYELQSGNYYILGAGWSGSHTFYWNYIHGAKSFGVSLKGFQVGWQSPLPNPAPSSSTTAAYMQRITTSDMALTYQWLKDDVEIPGASGPQYVIASMSEGRAGEYSVFIANDCGQQYSDYALVNVLPPAIITQQPQSQYVCTGGAAYFEVQASGTGLTYQWRKDGTAIPGATDNAYSISTVEPAHAGYYSVVVDSGCPVTSDSARLVVLAGAPTLTQQPQSQARCAGQSATFTVGASGLPGQFSYQWYKDDVAISGATNASYVLQTLALEHAGAYRAVVTNDCGSTSSNVATLTVDEALSIVVQPQAPPGDELCAGAEWELRVETTGTNVAYQWKKNGQNLPGATGDAYLIAAADSADAGTYTVLVSNDCGSLTSAPVTILVVAYPAILRQPRGVTVQPGAPFTLDVGLDLTTLNADVDEVGTRDTAFSGGSRLRANSYAAAQTTTLTRIEHYFGFSTSGPLRFFVYESSSGESGPYTLILNDHVASSGTGTRYYSSNPIEVRLAAGRHYLIGAAWTASCTYFRMDTFPLWPTAFGHHVRGYGATYSGTLPPSPVPNQDAIWPQRLTTVRTEGYCQWRKDGAAIPGAVSDIYRVTSAVPGDGGRYEVLVTNACGAVTSNSVSVQVQTAGTVPDGAKTPAESIPSLP